MSGVAFRDTVAPVPSRNATARRAAYANMRGRSQTDACFRNAAPHGTGLANSDGRPLHAPPGRAAGRLPNITQNPEELDA